MAKAADIAGRLGHAARAAVKTAWFGAHYVAARRASGPLARPDEAPFRLTRKLPAPAVLLADIRRLVAADRLNVERGFYPPPEGPPLDLGAALKMSCRFLDDAREVARRRRAGAGQEVAATAEPSKAAGLPRYYRQNFHFQTDGYLSEGSAALYDFQVETLFGGTAQAMRRQALPLLGAAFAGRDQRQLGLLELGCGTGALTAEIARAFPRLSVAAIDPSTDYLDAARRRLAGAPRARFASGLAEALPFADASFDAVASCYLFHELPPKIRKAAAAEIARVLKPGGTYVHLDSLQYGDAPQLDALLEAFPRLFHEPYYESYARLDLAALLGKAGLVAGAAIRGFLTKAAVFGKA